MKKIKANTLVRKGVIDINISENRAQKAHELNYDNRITSLCDKLVKDAKDASSFIREYESCCQSGSQSDGQYNNILYKMSSIIEVWSLLLKQYGIKTDELLEYLGETIDKYGSYDTGVILEWMERKRGESDFCKW